jgi:ubiquinone/menaquinone biosynthesis C-methylase UbiE
MIGSLRRRFLGFAFRLLYNELAFTYDAVAWLVSLGQWQAWGRTALSRVRGRRVLELGHGPGHMLIALARSGRSPIGIDLSAHMIRLAQRRLRKAGLSIPQVRCRVQALPFRSDTFDLALATFPTEYILDPLTLREVERVTTGRGRLIVVWSAQLAGQRAAVRFVEWLYGITGQREPIIEEHFAVFEETGWSAQFESDFVGTSEVTLIVANKTQAA